MRSAPKDRRCGAIRSHWAQTPDLELLERDMALSAEMEHDSEEAVVEIIETLLKGVLDKCFPVEVRQIVPYTSNWMKNHLLQIVEQHFMWRDIGDRPDDILPEDSEPPRAKPDPWAKCCVPLVAPPPPPRPISPKEVHMKPEVLPTGAIIPQPKVNPKLQTKRTSPKLPVANINKKSSSFPLLKCEKNIIRGPTLAKPGKFLPPLPKKTEDEIKFPTVKCEESAALQKHNENKALQKLDPARLPDHCVFPKYEIVDSNTKPQRMNLNRPRQEPKGAVPSQRTEAVPSPMHGPGVSTRPLRLGKMTLAKGVTLSQSLDLSQDTAPPQI